MSSSTNDVLSPTAIDVEGDESEPSRSVLGQVCLEGSKAAKRKRAEDASIHSIVSMQKDLSLLSKEKASNYCTRVGTRRKREKKDREQKEKKEKKEKEEREKKEKERKEKEEAEEEEDEDEENDGQNDYDGENDSDSENDDNGDAEEETEE
ncbi:hypothetical protein PGT21_022011 [Puccinia graminis f. sp. tritici]|uniref:Uncharacterized protein n=1 Tax=Puccinia graminis f. sp. tritici TaxID=56615 RepID=A0A5B0NV03_PUCGR|nr:hypothetical protein PGT21_022011 [Puccinia graminis f. sp. tritici]